MGARFRSWWQKRCKPLAVIGLIAALVVVIALIFVEVRLYGTGFAGKALWDWLQLLIIPAVLAIGGYVINLTISRSEQEATKQRAQSEREAAEKRAETEHEIALDSQRETALQEYIDRMSELLLHENLLGADPKKEVLEIARVQTITILRRLDADRKGIVIQFLREAGLIISEIKDDSIGDKSIISLHKADLRGANLGEAFLLITNLYQTDLCGANLSHAILDGANLGEANLSEADLSEATLVAVNLFKANLSGANLQGADLRGADLEGAIVTIEQLNTAKSLERAIMRDGSIHP